MTAKAVVESSQLVARARTGDRAAQRVLFEQHQSGVYNYLRSLVQDDHTAADLTQETFVKALGGLPRLRQAAAFTGWLYRIARNQARDHLNAAGTRRAASVEAETLADVPDPRGDASTALAASELSATVGSAVDSLSAEHREVVLLHHLQGYEVDAIAGLLGLRVGTVKSRLARAREALRRKLTPYLGSDR